MMSKVILSIRADKGKACYYIQEKTESCMRLTRKQFLDEEDLEFIRNAKTRNETPYMIRWS